MKVGIFIKEEGFPREQSRGQKLFLNIFELLLTP